MRTKKRIPKHAELGRAIAEQVVRAAGEQGMSPTRLAGALGVKASQVSAWRNKGSVPGGYYLLRLSQLLGVTTDWLLGIKGAPKERGLQLSHDEMGTQLAREVARMVAYGLPRVAPESYEQVWRPIQDVLERNIREEWSDPDKILRSFYGTQLGSPEEKRCLLAAMLALAFQDERRQRRRQLADSGTAPMPAAQQPPPPAQTPTP